MRVLVVGGSGFVGRHVVDILAAQGHVVGVFGRTPHAWMSELDAHLFIGDRKRLRDSAPAIQAFAPDVVVDLILSSGSQARELMEVLRGVARRLVVASSMDVYRACALLHGLEEGPLEPLPLTEDSRLRTVRQTYPLESVRRLQSVFGWLDDEYDKIAVEETVLAARELPVTVLRFPMLYGPKDRLRRLASLVKRMDARRPAIVIQTTLASWRSPRGYVENIAHAVTLAAADERTDSRVYNVAEQGSYSEREWIGLVAGVVGWRGEVVELPVAQTPEHLRVPGRLEQHWVVDSSRVRAELGYRELIPQDEALRRTVAWEREARIVDPATDRAEYDAEDSALRAANIGVATSGE